jgi:RHS repeat-associated protein
MIKEETARAQGAQHPSTCEWRQQEKSNVPDYVRRGGATYRVISDQLGSPRYVVNVANASDVPFTAGYTSFGEVTGTGLDWMPFGFAGGIYDADSRVVRFGARDVDATLGRWLNKDPIRFRSGQRNLFAYSGNDPVSHADPSGLAVYLCKRETDLPVFKQFDFSHEWVYTDSNGSVGMSTCSGPTNACPLLSSLDERFNVCVEPQTKDMYNPLTSCDEVPEADEDCVNAHMNFGESLGCFAPPANYCQTYAEGLLRQCSRPNTCGFDGAEGGPNACY